MKSKYQKPKLDSNWSPVNGDDNDEMFPNGIFVFNVTKMLEHIKNNPTTYADESVSLDDINSDFSVIDEKHMNNVQLGEPVVLAEISPEQFNLIDGNHRVEKAKRLGVKNILAFRLGPHQHIRFLTTQRGYEAYVGYWNEKLKTLEKMKLLDKAKEARA